MPGHYFSPKPDSVSQPRRIRIELDDLSFEIRTDGEVFSPRRLDPGTRILLDLAPTPHPGARVLDAGCGYGAIGLTLAQRDPTATVTAVDINERARALCLGNAQRLGLGNVAVVAPEALAGLDLFDAIYSNPPIRIGKAALHQLLLGWFERLNPQGVAHLVVNKNLGSDSLSRWLEQRGFVTSRIGSRQGYRVLRVARAEDLTDGG